MTRQKKVLLVSLIIKIFPILPALGYKIIIDQKENNWHPKLASCY